MLGHPRLIVLAPLDMQLLLVAKAATVSLAMLTGCSERL